MVNMLSKSIQYCYNIYAKIRKIWQMSKPITIKMVIFIILLDVLN